MKTYKNARVLVVDDNNVNLYVLSQVLEKYGIEADCVPSGKACVKKCSKKEYDLIFMDHMMPEMDGIEAFSIIKENPGFNTPVIALTGNTEEGAGKIYADNGFAMYMQKPVNDSNIEKALEQFLDNKADECKNVPENKPLVESVNNPKRDKMVKYGFTVIDELIESGMSIEAFEEILSIFMEESKEKLPVCDEHYNTLNMREYAVIVHGLKNDAAMISDMDLSAHAKEHEIESKGLNEDFVKEKWPELKEHWQETINRIENYFKED